MMLDGISIESAIRGGTMIGDAIRTVLNDVFDDQAKQYKDIVLITDGEDHESEGKILKLKRTNEEAQEPPRTLSEIGFFLRTLR